MTARLKRSSLVQFNNACTFYDCEVTGPWFDERATVKVTETFDHPQEKNGPTKKEISLRMTLEEWRTLKAEIDKHFTEMPDDLTRTPTPPDGTP